MARFLIEVPHEAEKVACALAVRVLLTTGSHFLTHADFGCLDGEHKAWITVEGGSKEEGRSILPPTYRSQAKIVKLNKFTLEGIEELRRQHDDRLLIQERLEEAVGFCWRAAQTILFSQFLHTIAPEI